MINKVCRFINNKAKEKFIRSNDKSGFCFVRDDRGAMEFVAQSPEIWKKANMGESNIAYAGYKSIYWGSTTDMSNQEVLKHELSHLEDDIRFGLILSRVIYCIFHVVYGYKNNPFEIKARRAEKE